MVPRSQRDKNDIDVLGNKLGIQPQGYIQLSVMTTYALRQSCIPNGELRRIEDNWSTLKGSANYSGTTLWNAYVKHYTEAIKDLNRDGLDGIKRANYIADLETIVAEMRFENPEMRNEIARANETASQALMQYEQANSVGIPATVPTQPCSVAPTTLTGPSQYANNTFCLTVEQLNALLQDRQAAAPQRAATPGKTRQPKPVRLEAHVDRILLQRQQAAAPKQARAATPGKTRQPRAARQFTRYCWTHGINVSHESNKCRTQADGHQVTATYGNRMGGSDKNEESYKKYLRRGKVQETVWGEHSYYR